jgi:segregation and condensation protein B
MNGDEENPSTSENESTLDGVEAEEGVGPGLSKTSDASKDTPKEVLLSRLESLIFVSPEPISVRRLARSLSLQGKLVRELLAELVDHYKDRGIILQEVSQGFQFRSHPENAPVVRNIFKMRPLKVSRPALETLAIVAYRQPLTRAEVEAIRGVDCGGVMKYLFEKGLIRVIGRKEEPGRPIIYGTSQAFLELFGLKSLSDLPALHEFSELWDEHQEMVDVEAPLEGEQETGEGTTEGPEINSADVDEDFIEERDEDENPDGDSQ